MYDDVEEEYLFYASSRLLDSVYDLIVDHARVRSGFGDDALRQLDEALRWSQSGLVIVPLALVKHAAMQIEKAYRFGDFDSLDSNTDALFQLELEVAAVADREYRLPNRPTSWNPSGCLPRWIADSLIDRKVEVKDPTVIPLQLQSAIAASVGR